jgi:hypothetical protein
MLELIAFIGGIFISIIAYFIIKDVLYGKNGIQEPSREGSVPYMFTQSIQKYSI